MISKVQLNSVYLTFRLPNSEFIFPPLFFDLVFYYFCVNVN